MRPLLTKTFATLIFLTLAATRGSGQDLALSQVRLPLRATLVLTEEFCSSRVAHGPQTNPKVGLEVGKVACVEFVAALKGVFGDLTTTTDPQNTGNAQLVLIPKFVDVGSIEGLTAFSNRELNVFLQWTVKDAAGKTVWIETVQGSATHHMGNLFTAKKNLKLIIDDAVRDVALRSANKMSSCAELRKLVQ